MLRSFPPLHPALVSLAENPVASKPTAQDSKVGAFLSKATNLAELERSFLDKMPIVGALYEFKVVHELLTESPEPIVAIYLPNKLDRTEIEALKWDLVIQLPSTGHWRKFVPLQVKRHSRKGSEGCKNFVFSSCAFPFLKDLQIRQRLAQLAGLKFSRVGFSEWLADRKLYSRTLKIKGLANASQENLSAKIRRLFHRISQMGSPVLLNQDMEQMHMSELIANLMKQRKLVKL